MSLEYLGLSSRLWFFFCQSKESSSCVPSSFCAFFFKCKVEQNWNQLTILVCIPPFFSRVGFILPSSMRKNLKLNLLPACLNMLEMVPQGVDCLSNVTVTFISPQWGPKISFFSPSFYFCSKHVRKVRQRECDWFMTSEWAIMEQMGIWTWLLLILGWHF